MSTAVAALAAMRELLKLRDAESFRWVVAALSGIGAGLAGCAPTGLAVWDVVLTAALGAVVVLAASRAPRWTTITLTAGAAMFAGFTVWLLVAAVGLLLACATAFERRRSRAMSAVAAALGVQTLLRLPSVGFFGLTAIISGLLIALTLVWGYRYADRRARLVVRRFAFGSLLVVTIFGVLGGLAAISARADIERGVAAANRGLSAARDADTVAVTAELAVAEEALEGARSRISAPYLLPVQLVPGVSQNFRSVSIATTEGAKVARSAALALNEADIASVRLTAGSVDLQPLAAMAPRLAQTADDLAAVSQRLGEIDSPWIVPAIRSRLDELAAEVHDVLPEARLAAQAAETLPAMLGSDGPRRYLIMFGTPAESRELGGLLGSWMLIEFDLGVMTRVDAGRVNRLYELANSNPLTVENYPEWFSELGRPSSWPQNLTSSPDFGLVAQASNEVLDGIGNGPVDGYVYMDTWAVIAMLDLLGPVQLPWMDEPLTSATAPSFFFEDQYLIDGARNDTFAELYAVFEGLFASLQDQRLPGPERLGQVLGPVARAGRLQVVSNVDSENDFLRSVHLLRDFQRDASRDSVALVQTNATSSKLDIYLRRHVDYQVEMAPDGSLTGSLSATFTSIVPADAPPASFGARTEGTNGLTLSFYSPHEVVEARIDGEPVAVHESAEFGYLRYLIGVDIPPNTTVDVVFDFVGQRLAERPYELEIWHQPLVHSDTMSVRYTGPDDSQITEELILTENVVLTVPR